MTYIQICVLKNVQSKHRPIRITHKSITCHPEEQGNFKVQRMLPLLNPYKKGHKAHFM